MKYRSYNEKNICNRTGKIFPTYFYTKREAVAYQKENGGVVERKIGNQWFSC